MLYRARHTLATEIKRREGERGSPTGLGSVEEHWPPALPTMWPVLPGSKPALRTTGTPTQRALWPALAVVGVEDVEAFDDFADDRKRTVRVALAGEPSEKSVGYSDPRPTFLPFSFG